MKIVPLGDIATVELSNIDKKSKDDENEVILCNFVDVYHNWQITNETAKNFMHATANINQISKFAIRKGQVAITKDSETRDDIGVATYIAENIENAVLGYHCALITPDESILTGEYLNIIMHTPYTQKYFEMNASGSGQRYTLTKEIIEAFPIPLPDIDTQKNLGKLMSDIDSKIALNNSICANLETMAKQIYDYWFVQYDFPNANGRPYKSSGGKMVWNDELKREIPEGWGVTKVGSITINHDSKRIPLSNKEREEIPGTIPYYGATAIMGYVDKSIFNGDYVLLAEDGSVMDDRGYPILQRITGKTWVNNHAHVLEPTNGYHCKLLMLVLGYIPVVKIKTGSIQMKVNQENLNGYKVVDIPSKYVSDINVLLDDIDAKIIQMNLENKNLAEMRDFLLPMLMNGQIKVEG